MAEAAALQVVRRQELGSGFDGVLLVLAFLEAGRLTAADIHWGRIGPHLVRGGQTEFAQDPVSGYAASDLKDVHGGGDGGQRAVVRLRGAGGENHRFALGRCVAEQGRQLADLVYHRPRYRTGFPPGEQSRAVTERGHQAGQRVAMGVGLSRAR